MSYVWFNSVLEALGKRINFESISCLYGNSFAKDAGKIIQQMNPLQKNGGHAKGNVTDLFGSIKIVEAPKASAADQKKMAESKLGDLSWADGLF